MPDTPYKPPYAFSSHIGARARQFRTFADLVSPVTAIPVRIFAFHSPILPVFPAMIAPRTRSIFASSSGAPGRFSSSKLIPLPRKLTFTGPEEIQELARRGEAWGDSESREMLEHSIEVGRGGVYLRPTAGQYAMLRRA
jgi:hypothetical protein